MGQLNESSYLKLNPYYGRSDGVFVEKSTGDIVVAVNGSVVARFNGTATSLALADGNILVGDASGAAAPVVMSGDAAIDNTGAVAVSDLTIASESRGDILRRSATAWERVDAKTAGRVVMGDGTDVISQALSGDVATISGNGKVSLAENFRLRSATTDTTAGASTYTLAKVRGGIILRDPNGADRSDVTDNAQALLAGLNTPAAAGQFFDCYVVNTADANETITLTAAAGVTLSPTTIKIGRGEVARLLFRADNVGAGTEAVTCYLLKDNFRTVQDNGGLAVGYVYFDGVGNPADTETVSINARSYEFDDNAAITGNVSVTIGADARATAANLATAINADASGVVHARKVNVGASAAVVELVPKSDVTSNYALVEAATNVSVSAASMVGGTADAHKQAHFYKYTVTAADEAVLTNENGVILIAAVPSSSAPGWFMVQRYNGSGVIETSANVFYTWVQLSTGYYGLQILESQIGATDVNSGDIFYVMVNEA